MGTRLVAALAVAVLALAGCRSSDDTEPQGQPTTIEAVPSTPSPAAPTPAPTPPPAPESSPTTPPAPASPPPEPETRAALVERLQELVRAAEQAFDEANAAVLVVDEYGRELVNDDADLPLLPASTMKSVTAAAVLSTLGPNSRLTTSVEGTSGVEGDGVVRGDLLLVGGGDPVLATPEYGRYVYPARPRTPIEALAQQLVDLGVRRVEGDLVAAAPRYNGDTLANGWPDRYLSSFDARHIDGLTVDGGLVTILTYPESDDDEPGPTPDSPSPTPSPSVSPTPTGPPEVRVELARDPRLQAVAALAAALEDLEVEVAGEVRHLGEDEEVSTVGRLARVESPPISDLLRFTVQRSDNHLADTFFKLIGRARTGEGNWQQGERALSQVLDRYGIATEGLRMADGSGLSRSDRLTARALVDLDRTMTAGRHGQHWMDLMAVAGESGTLRDRLRNTPAAGRFRGKTGTLNDVVAIHGMVTGEEGRYHLAVLTNDASGTDRSVARALIDEVVLALVADLERCRIGPARNADDGPLGIPPSLVVCA